MNDIYDGAGVFNVIFQEFIKIKPNHMPNDFLNLIIEMVDELHFKPFSDSRDVSYVCSLTTDGDSLPMWRNYTSNNGGYNIKIDPQILYEYCSYDFGSINAFLIPVVYDCDVMLKILSSYLLKISTFWNSDEETMRHIKANLYNFIVLAKLLFKHPSFSYEQEVRLVKLDNRMYDVNLKKSISPNEDYIATNGILRPYKNLRLPLKALIGITVGPLLEAEIAKHTIENVIGSYIDWRHPCPVEISQAPIRF